MDQLIMSFANFIAINEAVDNNIRNIQQALKNKGYGNLLGTSGPNRDGVDGMLGSKTKAAIIAFQKANGIKQTGFVGPVTAPKLGVQPMSSSRKSTPSAAAQSAKPTTTTPFWAHPLNPTKRTQPSTQAKPAAQTAQPNLAKPTAQPVKPAPTKTAAPAKTAPVENTSCPSVKNSPYLREFAADVEWYKRDLMKKLRFAKDPYEYIDDLVRKDAKIYSASGVETRTACEIALTGRRPSLRNKNVFVVDTLKQTVYLFGKPDQNSDIRPLIARDVMQSGSQQQKNDAQALASAFMTLNQVAVSIGAEVMPDGRWLDAKTKTDVSGKVWNTVTREGNRMLPAGKYDVYGALRDPNYAGSGNNVLALKNWDGKYISQALHGIVKSNPDRVKLNNLAASIVKNPEDDKQMQEFINMVETGGINLKVTFGCIGLTSRFLAKVQPYLKDAIVLNLAEDQNNYLVQNTEEFFEAGSKTPDENTLLANVGAVKVGGFPEQSTDQTYYA